MPVYREADSLPAVLDDWSSLLAGAGIDYEMRAYDDGSPDASLALLLEHAARDPRLVVRSHPNRGHGLTILRGYREARGRFVLQVDSDDEIAAEPFLALWHERDALDFGVGARSFERRAAARRLVSGIARLTVRTLFGPGIRDPNCPYRLMRRDWLRGALARLPDGAFAPNILLAGLAIRDGLRVRELCVVSRGRRTGAPSLGHFSLWRGAWLAFRDTLRVARGSP
jgi:dolichol-phosphate mannosyltransferase